MFLKGLGDTSRELVGASLEFKIRATLVDHMVTSCAGSLHPGRPNASHALTFKLDHSSDWITQVRLLNGFRHSVRLGCDAVEVVAWSRYIDGRVGNVRYLSCPSGYQFCSNISCSFPTFSNIKLNYDAALVEWHLLLKAVFSVTLVNLMLVIIGADSTY